jgi:hypothetical protein
MCFVNKKLPFCSTISVVISELDYFHFELCCVTYISPCYIEEYVNGYRLEANRILASLKHINTIIKMGTLLPLLQVGRNPTLMKGKGSDILPTSEIRMAYHVDWPRCRIVCRKIQGKVSKNA